MSAIHKTISDSNLALQIKEGYENSNYVPITSTGFRQFSSLNSRKNGVAEGFNDLAGGHSCSTMPEYIVCGLQNVSYIL